MIFSLVKGFTRSHLIFNLTHLLRKKGKKTDYVARLYLGSVGKVDRGIVSVNAYGIYSNITLPLSVKVFKPKGTLKVEDKYRSKINIAVEIITELMDEGFNIELVLADSFSGESSQFISKSAEYNERVRCSNFVVIMESGCHLIRWLELISGVNLRESLVIKNQKLDTLEK